MEVLKMILPVFLMLGIGMVCRKTQLLSREGINALKSVVVNIMLPAVLLHAFASTQYAKSDLVIPVLMFVICVAAWLLGKAGARLLRIPSRYTPFLTTGFEAGMLGYALFTMLYGSERIAELAKIDIGHTLFVFTLYKFLLAKESGEQKGMTALLKEMVFSPIMISLFAGLLIGVSGLYQALIPSGISGVLDACTDFVSAPTGAVILLTIGYDLVFRDVAWAKTLKVVCLRYVILLVLCFVFIRILLLTGNNLRDAACVMFLLPPPFVLSVIADDENERAGLSSALSVSTVVALAGFAVLAAI